MESEKNRILRFINNEKDISKAKVSFLKRTGGFSVASKRIIDIEDSFIGFDFDKINLSTVVEAREAVGLYKSSRALFCIRHNIEYEDVLCKNISNYDASSTNKAVMLVAKKFDYVNNISKFMKNIKPQETNPVQDLFFFKMYCDYFSRKNGYSEQEAFDKISSIGIDELLKREPVMVSRSRARHQAAYCAAGIFLSDELLLSDNFLIDKLLSYEDSYYNGRSILGGLGLSKYSPDDILSVCASADNVINNIMNSFLVDYFKYYNDALGFLGDMHDTMGFNKALAKVSYMVNVLDPNIADSNITAVFPGSKDRVPFFRITEFNSSKGSGGHKKCGILLPIPRVGNEKMDIFYKKIIMSDVDVTTLFKNKCSNIVISPNNIGFDYYKALVVRGAAVGNISSVIDDDASIIDLEKSTCLVAKTRSENDFLSGCAKNISGYFNIIKNDYLSIDKNTINSRIDRIKMRKDIIYKISGK